MIIFPAIDLKKGKVVRLTQGDYDQVTQYTLEPLEQAKNFEKAGCDWLHVVDLDAAKAGKPVNQSLIQSLAQETQLNIQIGGGIRSLDMAQAYLESGIERVIIGTQAVKEPQFLAELAQAFPNRIALGLDTKDGQIAIQGWTQSVNQSLSDYLKKAPLKGVACLIFTDISRDGMLTGPNLAALKEALDQSPIPVIASGGVSCLEDLKALKDLQDPKLMGAITGKALYEGKLDLREALAL